MLESPNKCDKKTRRMCGGTGTHWRKDEKPTGKGQESEMMMGEGLSKRKQTRFRRTWCSACSGWTVLISSHCFPLRMFIFN